MTKSWADTIWSRRLVVDDMLDPQPADPCLKQPGNAGGALLRFDCVTGQKVCTQSDASVLNAKERFNDICPTNYEASVGLPAHEVFAEIDEDGSGTIDRHEPLGCIQPGHHAHQTWKHHLWFRHVLNRISWAYVIKWAIFATICTESIYTVSKVVLRFMNLDRFVFICLFTLLLSHFNIAEQLPYTAYP